VLDIVCVCVGFVTRGEKAWDEDLQTNWTETTNTNSHRTSYCHSDEVLGLEKAIASGLSITHIHG
jgi:hypothetical protein